MKRTHLHSLTIAGGSRGAVRIIRTDEERMIARSVGRILGFDS